MKYGLVFPKIEIDSDPIVIKDYVQAVEGLGYDYLLVYDHVLGPTRIGPAAGKVGLTPTVMLSTNPLSFIRATTNGPIN